MAFKTALRGLVIGVVVGLSLSLLDGLIPGPTMAPAPENPKPLASTRRGVAGAAATLAKPMTAALRKKGDTTLPPECRSFHQKLLKEPLTRYSDARFSASMFDLPLTSPETFAAFVSTDLPPEDPCGAMPQGHPLRELNSMFDKACRLPSREGGTGKKNAELSLAINWCFHLWQRYRLTLIDRSTGALPISTISDEGVLIAKLGARMTSRRTAGQYNDMIEIAHRLHDLKSDRGYDELALKLEFDRVSETKDLSDRERLREALEEKLETDDRVENAQAIEMRVLLAKDREDVGAMRELAEELRERSPEKAEYYLAWAAHLAKQPGEAREHLSGISDKHPLARFALAQLANSGAKAKEPFSAIGLGWGAGTPGLGRGEE